MASKLESDWRTGLIKRIEAALPGCMVLFQNAQLLQGVPDILILHKHSWAALETKRAFNSSRRPNQGYYVRKMDGMAFAAFINPENEEVVLGDMISYLECVNMV